MRFIKILSLLLAAALIFCGCEAETVTPPVTDVVVPEEIPEETEYTEEEPFTLRIPFDYEEGVAPYTAFSKPNRFVCELIYRSMVNLKSDYSYELDLLTDIRTDDNITWYLYIDEGSTFPDGTEFTAYDLRYSLQQAMDEDSYYAKSLSVVSSSKVIDATCLRVVLHYANRYFPNLLTFPVISFETVDNPRYFTDRYYFSEDGKHLICDVYSAAQEIELVSATDMDLLTYEMRMGKYDCIYETNPMDLGSSSNGATMGMQSNRMVYLGMNSSSAFTYYADFRRAVSVAMDYNRIATDIYGHFASAPKRIYNPDFYEMQYVSKNSLDLMSANLILDDMGLDRRDDEGFRTNSRGKRISLKLIVCNESTVKVNLANAVAEMLAEAGIEVEVNALSYVSFMTALRNYDYDLYIAEMRLGPDMDLTSILTPYQYQFADFEYINYGVPNSEKLYLSWLGFMAGTVTPSEFASDFEDVTPFVPLCYTKGCTIFNRSLPFTLFGTDYDMFYNILEWKIE